MAKRPRLDFTAHAHPVLAVVCPDCRADVGAWCKRPSGHKAMDLHKARKIAADRAWEDGNFPPIVRTETGWAYARRASGLRDTSVQLDLFGKQPGAVK